MNCSGAVLQHRCRRSERTRRRPASTWTAFKWNASSRSRRHRNRWLAAVAVTLHWTDLTSRNSARRLGRGRSRPWRLKNCKRRCSKFPVRSVARIGASRCIIEIAHTLPRFAGVTWTLAADGAADDPINRTAVAVRRALLVRVAAVGVGTFALDLAWAWRRRSCGRAAPFEAEIAAADKTTVAAACVLGFGLLLLGTPKRVEDLGRSGSTGGHIEESITESRRRFRSLNWSGIELIGEVDIKVVRVAHPELVRSVSLGAHAGEDQVSTTDALDAGCAPIGAETLLTDRSTTTVAQSGSARFVEPANRRVTAGKWFACIGDRPPGGIRREIDGNGTAASETGRNGGLDDAVVTRREIGEDRAAVAAIQGIRRTDTLLSTDFSAGWTWPLVEGEAGAVDQR